MVPSTLIFSALNLILSWNVPHNGSISKMAGPGLESHCRSEARRGTVLDVSERKPSARLRLKTWVPWAVGLNAAAMWLGLKLVQRRIGPTDCRWCNGPRNGPPHVWGPDETFRIALRARDTKTADKVSSVLAFGLLPAWSTTTLLLLRKDRWHDRLVDLSLLFEAVTLASLLQQITRLAVARRRPEATFHRVAGDQGFENTSFFSGHTTFAFTLAASALSILQIRRSRWTWLVALVGFSAATAVGLLRISADKHFMSDVLVGAMVGTATGLALPGLCLRW